MSSSLENEHIELLQFMYGCPVGLVELREAGTIGMINPLAMQLLLPIARSQIVTNFFDIMEKYAPELRNLSDAYDSSQGTVFEGHRIFVSPGTKAADFESQVLACTLVKLGTGRYIVSLTDVSGQVAQERRLKQAETWFASLLDSVNDFAVVSLDADGRIEAVNPSVVRQTGFSKFEVLGRTLDVFDPSDPAAGSLSVSEQIALARRDGWHLYECWQNRREESPYWCQRLIAVRSELEDDGERAITGYTVVLRDVTQQNSDTVKLTQMLRTDYLTGACNRAYFFEVAERECIKANRYQQALALIAIDLDHFKAVNDTYGHGIGDAVLKAFVEACVPTLRPRDTLARLGGEEFVVLLPSTNLEEAGRIAERLRKVIAQTEISVKGSVLNVTVSLGCAELRKKAGNVSDLLGSADEALYRAKQLGRDRVIVSVNDAVNAVIQ